MSHAVIKAHQEIHALCMNFLFDRHSENTVKRLQD